MEMTIEDILIMMRELFEKTSKRKKELNNNLSVWDKKRDECEHYIENHKRMSVGHRCKITERINEAREGRREVKNEMEIIQCCLDMLIDKYNNKFILKDIDLTLQEIKRIKKRQENPSYKYQYLTEDLEFIEEEAKGENNNQDTDFVQVQEEQPTDIN